jgi:hypothetical protein
MSSISSLGANTGVQQSGQKHHHKKAGASAENSTAPSFAQQPTPPTSKKLDKTV